VEGGRNVLSQAFQEKKIYLSDHSSRSRQEAISDDPMRFSVETRVMFSGS